MTAAYPKRQTHFAHKLVRLMLHSCAAQEIGADGFLVVAAIAHAEDAKRYSGPVTYWNEQLLPILGFGSWGQLDRARKRAIDAGWLHYEGGGKGKVGKYWATIPAHLLDAPDVSTEADHHVSFSRIGEPNVKETGKKRERTEGQPGDNRGTSGEHSTLSLSLPLSLNTHTHTQEPAAREVPALRTWTLPDGCSDDLAAAIDSWQAWRTSVDGRPTDGIRLTLMLSQARSAGWDDEKICRSIPFSVAKGAKSWLDPDVDFQRQRGSNGKQTKQNRGFLDG